MSDGRQEEFEDDMIDARDVAEEIDVEDNPEAALETALDDMEMGDAPNEENGEEEGDESGPTEPIVDDSVIQFTRHESSVFAIALSPSSEFAVTGGQDDVGYLWRVATGETIAKLEGHTDTVADVCFNHDGTYVATGGMDGPVRVWSGTTGALVCELEGPDETQWVSWHPRGNVVLAGAASGQVWMWNVPGATCMGVFSGHTSAVTCGAFTPDGKSVVSGSDDGTFILWDPKTGEPVLRMGPTTNQFHDGAITTLACHPDSVMVLTGGIDHHAKLIHTKTGKVIGSLNEHTDIVTDVGFCSSHGLAASTSTDGKLCIWDLGNLRLRLTCQHPAGAEVVCLNWLADQPLVATGATDGIVRLWDARSGRNERSFSGHSGEIHKIAIVGGGKGVASAGEDGVVRVFAF